MERYQKVEKPKISSPVKKNEIRITSQGRMRNYITYATSLLQDHGCSEIVLKGMGRAINKTVMVAELIKRRIGGLYQTCSIGSTDITDTWEPLEEGLLPLVTTRHVSMITIMLSKKELDASSTGYQPPLLVDQVKPLNEFEAEGEGSPRIPGRRCGGRGRGRAIGNYNPLAEYNRDGSNGRRGYGGSGRSNTRSRIFRGQGQGHDGQAGGYHDHGESQIPPPQVREFATGRGKGRGHSPNL